MPDTQISYKVGYVVKMFPRLSETFILREIIELERQGTEVMIFSLKKPNEGRFHPQVTAVKAPVHYLEDYDAKKWYNWLAAEWSELRSHQQGLWDLLDEALSGGIGSKIENVWWAAWIASMSAKLGLQRLHAHFASLPSSVAYYAHRISGITYSLTAHAKDIFVYDLDEHLLRKKLQTAQPLVTVTDFNRRYLLEKAPDTDPERIRVIHNGIDLDQFQPVPPNERASDLILGVGRLVIKKGFTDLLDACALLKQRGTKFRCVIIGDGPEGDALREKQKSLGLTGEVTFLGARNIAEVRSLMREATVFCLPCTVAPDNNIDALPTVLLEALACGLPSLSTTISGIPEIIDSGTDGLLVPPDDPEALSVQLERLLADPDLRLQLARNGREKAIQKFDIHKNVGELLQTFQDGSA